MSTSAPKPYSLQVPEADIADLRQRLSRTRWPDEPPHEAWSSGTSLEYMRGLTDYWRTGFDWRQWEAKLNGFRQFTANVGGIDLHFIHEPGRGPNPMPLLISHGWPGSVFEFHKLIPLLREHFTVIAPSLPGYTLSFKPGQKRFSVEAIAGLYAELMTDVLGYQRFAAQGGDWGAFVASVLGHRYPERADRHPSQSPGRAARPQDDREPDARGEGVPRGARRISSRRRPAISGSRAPSRRRWHSACPTRRLVSPPGSSRNSAPGPTAAAIRRMRSAATRCWPTSRSTGSRAAIGSSFWPYYARMHGPWPIPEGQTVNVPMGYAEFPKEILHPPRSLAARTYTDIRRWSVMQKGGHFAALEQPETLAHEVVEFFRALR